MHEPEADIGSGNHLVLLLGSMAVALDKACVREIRRWSPPTPLPGAVAGRIGAINLRGVIIPVFDLAPLTGSEPLPVTDKSLIVVAEVQNRLIGIVADQVTPDLPAPDTNAAPPSCGGTAGLRKVERFDPAVLLPGAVPPTPHVSRRSRMESENGP